jgi:hypothetical protein
MVPVVSVGRRQSFDFSQGSFDFRTLSKPRPAKTFRKLKVHDFFEFAFSSARTPHGVPVEGHVEHFQAPRGPVVSKHA